MFITRKKVVRLIAPVALATGLVLTGCTIQVGDLTGSGRTATVDEPSAEEDDSIILDSTIDRLDAAPADAKSVLTDLSATLDTIAGLDGVGISYYGPVVDLNVVIPEAASGNITADQLKQLLSMLESVSYPATVEGFTINVWGSDMFAADSSEVGAEIGMKDAFLDAEWQWIQFAVTDLGSLYK